MITIAIVFVAGLVIGGTIVHVFGTKIDTNVAKVVSAYNTELAAITANHTAAAVKAVAPTTNG